MYFIHPLFVKVESQAAADAKRVVQDILPVNGTAYVFILIEARSKSSCMESLSRISVSKHINHARNLWTFQRKAEVRLSGHF